MDVVGIGVAARDITVGVDPWPAPERKTRAAAFAESGGGPVPTALVTMARLGNRCALGGVVGDDDAGRFVIEGLRAEGVDTSCVIAKPGLATPTSVILVDATGRRSILEWNQTALPATAEDLAPMAALIDRCRALLLDARLPDIQAEAARRARRAGALVVLDCGHPRPGAEALIALSDVAVLSHSYARSLHGGDYDPGGFVVALRGRMASGGRRIAGITLGADGCLMAEAGGATRHVSAPRVEAVDTTGAGDVFHGAFVHELLRGGSPEDAARFACAAAALSCRGLTGRAALPQEDAIRRAISY